VINVYSDDGMLMTNWIPVIVLTKCCTDLATKAYGEARCLHCGHRVNLDGEKVQQSRSRPPWTWPGELRNRRKARGMGRR
jgi:hypothetical protein